MINITNLNKEWQFEMPGYEPEMIDVPHTWNAKDGQDGGNDYFRGVCIYEKRLGTITRSKDEDVFIEFNGVNQQATVTVNGQYVGEHKGGYSTFRYNITSYLNDENVLRVEVSNIKCNDVYPQSADFTFFGGIYRDVNLITVGNNRFDIEYLGGNDIMATPEQNSGEWFVDLRAFVKGEGNVSWTIYDGQSVVCTAKGNHTKVEITNPVLWNGLDDPHLYTAAAELEVNGAVVDKRKVKFGLRTYDIDPQKGFILNGKPYPLRGVSRHQDRKNKGYAVGKSEHEEDMALIKEIGANSVRLAHYQQDRYFYDLCDENGIIVWAEAPYITEELPNGNENILSQMRELIIQNYNHASIGCWGISNEITFKEISENMIETHDKLVGLVKELDKTRPSVIAHVFTLKTDNKFVYTADACAYNLYYGWYVGDMSEYLPWFEKFHKEHPQRAIGLSEYGADGMPTYQSGKPEIGDYTEGYQALYHEKVLEQIEQMPYLWCSYVWNMFDFASDSREEGGEPGINHKGLVTYDRKIKKDSFYVYKAYWSKVTFVHIVGKRYLYRNERLTKIKIYTNQSKVDLYQDDKLVETKTGKYIFEFDVEISGKHKITAVSGELQDEFIVEYTAEQFKQYVCVRKQDSNNWLDSIWNSDCYSVDDKIGDIIKSSEGRAVMENLIESIHKNRATMGAQVTDSEDTLKNMSSFTLSRLLTMAGSLISEDTVKKIAEDINKIKKTLE